MKKIFFVLMLNLSTQAFAQTTAPNKFLGDVDAGITINKVLLMPVTDNVKGIYSTPVEEELKSLLDKNLKWLRIDFNSASPAKEKWSANSFEGNSELVKQIGTAHSADGVITANISKGPAGINAQLQLFLSKDGLPLAEETFKSPTMFETSDVRSEFKSALERLEAKMPYQGMILSRKGQSITVNMGTKENLKVNDELPVILILKINRHPRLKFAIGSEKEIIGRIKIFKVDTGLSFGNIIFEKESGVVAVGSKVLSKAFVSYPVPMVGADGKLVEGLSNRNDQDVSFGNNPKEWHDYSRPQYGRVGLFVGNSFYNHNTNLNTIGGIAASSSISPNIALKGELWITSELILDYKIRQSVFSITNNLGGSSSGSVNMSLNQYGVGAKYSLLMTDDFFGPKWNIGGGFTQTKFDVDNTTPLTYTSNNFGGLHFNLGGQFPLNDEMPFLLGAEFVYYLTKTLAEGTSSGSASSEITSFEVYADYLLNSRNTLRGEIIFENYSGKMSGTGSRTYPATSTSHRLTTINLGYNWLF